MAFFDEARIQAISGKGGNGCLVSDVKNIYLEAVQMVETEVMAEM